MGRAENERVRAFRQAHDTLTVYLPVGERAKIKERALSLGYGSLAEFVRVAISEKMGQD